MRLASIVPGIATLFFAGSAFAATGTPHHTAPTPAPSATPLPWESTTNDAHADAEPEATPRMDLAQANTTTGSSSESGIASKLAAPSGPLTYRPSGRSLGIGFGYTFPSSWSSPNTISARLRLNSSLAIEPIARLDVNSSSGKIDTAKTSSTGFDLFAGTGLRKTFAARQQVDAVGILNAGVGVNSTSGKAGGTSTSSTTVSLSAGWGLGAEYWPKQHWSISLDATNPLLSVSSSSGKQPFTDPVTGTTTIVKQSNTAFFVGAVWDPAVVLMTHLYY